jgi:hypothetical protein
MGKKDDRSVEDKAAWEAGQFTEEEARQAQMAQEEMNRAREEQERELGNPLAPPD